MVTITYNERTHRLVPVEPNNTALDWVDPGFGTRKEAWERILASFPQPEPVEVEPVAFTNNEQLAFLKYGKHTGIPMAMWGTKFYESVDVALYTAPPDYEEIKRQLKVMSEQRDVLVKALEKALPSINDIRDLQAASAALASVKTNVGSSDEQGGAA